MAVLPNGSQIPLAQFYQMGYTRGTAAAQYKRPRSAVDQDIASEPYFQDPRYQASNEDRGTYRTAWYKAYDTTLAQLSPQEQQMAKTATAEEEKKLTVDQWEQQTNIPSWSVAEAVANNFNNDVNAFQSNVSSSQGALATKKGGPEFLARALSFIAQWQGVHAGIKTHVGTPSGAVAEVRKARSALGTLRNDYTGLMQAAAPIVPVIPVTPPPVVPPPGPPVVPNAGAKAKIPGWAIVAAIAAAAGGIFVLFRKKKPAPPALPPRPGVPATRPIGARV